MATMTASQARLLWKALVDNASRLVADAHLLLGDSPGRARSLTVLAQEELGKALWIYDAFHLVWNTGVDEERTVDALRQHGRDHARKYYEAVVFGEELAEFWGDYSNTAQPNDGETWEQFWGRRHEEAAVAASEANLAKQRGFYVDVAADGGIVSPTDADSRGIGEDLERAARVVEMLLIRDHSRMKLDANGPYDSTHEQQFRLLPVSHPDEFRSWIESRDESLGAGDQLDGGGD
jgi:AbiV family abortive infection protein